MVLVTGLALGACAPAETGGDDVGNEGAGAEGDLGKTTDAICVSDGKYHYRGHVDGYETWQYDCSYTGYQIDPCRGDHYAYKRSVQVAYNGTHYYLLSAGAWHRGNRCS